MHYSFCPWGLGGFISHSCCVTKVIVFILKTVHFCLKNKMAQTFTDIQKVGDSAIIIKINVDNNPGTAQTYRVSGIPALFIFKNGEIKWRQAGVVPANELVKQLQNIINN